MSKGDEFDPVGPGEDRPTEELDPSAVATAGSPPARHHRAEQVTVRGYRVSERIGAGGMGEVFRAEQLQPIRRQVALKVIKRGMDSREVVARFASERRALALMSHPSIAGIYDAGVTEQGRPFFAMEYVRGEPITRYCDRQRLGVRQRIELFLDVCDGVQHAHQKGIIHRDLKPSNVLVTFLDERAVPKIIDFGIAKATTAEPGANPVRTTVGAMIGTPEYMSPEQAETSGLDVDTRSDIYSLGVVLYELLAGSRPFNLTQTGVRGFDEVRRRIRDEEPPKPSTRVSRQVKAGDPPAETPGRDLPLLRRQLRGDLDWIVMKALEKDRTRRYQTANALRLDLERHLANQPVLAGPPSAAYRVRKFVRRHRGGVAAVAVVAVAVVAGAVGTTAGLLRALRAEGEARQEARAARQVSDFLIDIFQVSDPDRAQGERITAREILDEGAARIATGLRDQPLTQARMMNTIGTVYRHLGLYAEAEDQLRQGLTQRRRLAGEDSLEVAESLHALSVLHRLQGRYDVALEEARRALAIRERALGRDHVAVAEALESLASTLARRADYAEAVPLFERALTVRGAQPGDQRVEIAETRSQLGVAHWRLGELEVAENELREALASLEVSLRPADLRLASTLNSLAVLYWQRKKLEQAEPLFLRTLTLKERSLGPNHPEVAHTLNNLGLIYDAQGRSSEAVPLIERAAGILSDRLGEDHDTTAMGWANLAWVYYREGRYAEAESLYQRAFRIYARTVGTEHPSVAILLRDEAQLLAAAERFAEARDRLQRAARIWEATGGPEHPELAATLVIEAQLLVRWGRGEEAADVYRRALEIERARLGAGHARVRELEAELGRRAAGGPS